MTQEEKQLLLKDLCARLPYGVRVKLLCRGPEPKFDDWIEETLNTRDIELFGKTFKKIQPYLRPMSTMTEEEKKYISERCGFSIAGPIRNECELIMPVLAADWLIGFYNERHFDFHGLIKRGLAIEAPEGMYEQE